VIPETLLKQLESAGASARDHGFCSGRRLLGLGPGRAKVRDCRRVPDPPFKAVRRNPRSLFLDARGDRPGQLFAFDRDANRNLFIVFVFEQLVVAWAAKWAREAVETVA